MIRNDLAIVLGEEELRISVHLQYVRVDLLGVGKFLLFPVFFALLFSFATPSLLTVGSYALGVLAYALLFPWLRLARLPGTAEVLSSKSVDLVYYSLGILGACLFFLANSVSQPEFENRKAAAAAYSDLAFYSWFRPEYVFSQQEYLDALKLGLLQKYKEYIESQDKRLDECAPETFDEYEFCEIDVRRYRVAEAHVGRGYVSVERGRTSTAWMRSPTTSREILVLMEPAGIPIIIDHKRFGRKVIVFPSTTLFDYQFLRGDGAKAVVDRAMDDAIAPLLEQAQARVDYLEEEYIELQDFQTISDFTFYLGNTWPYVLIMALSLKLARNRYGLSKPDE